MTDEYFTITDKASEKTSEIYKRMSGMFPCWKSSLYTDEYIDGEFPAPNKETTRFFKKTVEPDIETLGLSTKQVQEKGISLDDFITIRERMLMEMEYFTETGNHLDIKGLTFCSGSRDADGFVPSVYRGGSGKVRVGWCSVDSCNSDYGIRVAVSLDTLSSDPVTLVNFGTLDEYKKVGTIYQKTSNGELKFIYEI